MRCMTSQSLSQEDEEAGERLPDVALLDAKIAEAERAIAEGETTGEKRRAMERREDLMRLKRVEQIYVRTRHPERRLSSVPHPRLTRTERRPASAVRVGARFAQAPPGNRLDCQQRHAASCGGWGGLPAGCCVA